MTTYYGKELMDLLRLRDHPVAVKIFRKGGEFTKEKIETAYKEFRRPRVPITCCQAVNLARVHEECILAQEEDTACSYAAVFLGFIKEKQVADVFKGVRDGGWGRASAKAYEKALDYLPEIEYGTVFVSYAPLSKVEQFGLDYDIVIIHCNPAQATLLINAKTWKSGGRLTFTTAAENGTCGEAIAQTYVNQKFTIAFPCYGTRRYGLAGDEQLIIGMAQDELSEIVDNLKEMSQPNRGRQFPIRQMVEVPLAPPFDRILGRKPVPDGASAESWRRAPEPPAVKWDRLE